MGRGKVGQLIATSAAAPWTPVTAMQLGVLAHQRGHTPDLPATRARASLAAQAGTACPRYQRALSAAPMTGWSLGRKEAFVAGPWLRRYEDLRR